MSLPDGVPRVTVTTGLPLMAPGGTPVQGKILFVAPGLVVVPDLDLTIEGAEVLTLAAGLGSIDLIPGDVAGMSPNGWTYEVRSAFTNAPNWVKYLRLSTADTTVMLADRLVPDPDLGNYVLVTGPQGPPGPAGADGATGPPGPPGQDKVAGPWRFSIEDHGAVANVRVLTDGATQAGVARVVCGSSLPFTNADAGKVVIIPGAGASGVTSFASVIASVTSGSTAVLQDAPSQTLTGATVIFGSNAYAAANAATEAAEAYLNGTGSGAASTPHTYAQVYTPPNAYIIHGPLQTAKHGNGQVIFGVYDPAKQKPGLAFEGESPVAAGVRHWQQMVPQGGGSCWISSFVYASTSASNTDQDPAHNGIAGIISGPNEGTLNGPAYGSVIGGTATYSNIAVPIRNMSFLTAHSSLGLSIGFANLFGTANMIIENVSESTLGIVPATDYESPPSFSAGFSVALVGPSPGNNDLSYIRNLSVQGGHTFGPWISEHTICDRVMVLYTWAALVIVGTYGGSVGASHAVKITQASIEACTHELYFIGTGAQGITMVDVDQLQTEDGHPNISGNGAPALAAAVGRVKWTGLFTADNVAAQLTDGSPTPCGIEQVNGQVPRAIRRITADHAATALDRTIIGETAAAPLTVTLPDAGFCAVEYAIINDGTNTLTLATTAGQPIRTGGTTATTRVLAAGQTARVQAAYDGSAWSWYLT
jgi:hypothetical protein